MVVTRPNTTSGTHKPTEMRITQGEREDSDTIHVQRPHSRKLVHVPTTSSVPATTRNTTSSSTGGMEDIILTSPSSSLQESLRLKITRTPKRKRSPPVPDRTLSSALRQLVAKPTTSKGTAHNPIILDEYSPRRKPVALPTREQTVHEPHKFQDRHRKLYTYRPLRTALAPKPAQGNTFTGNKNNNIYRMMNAKSTSVNRIPPPSYRTPKYGVPFQVQYPMSAQYLAQQSIPETRPQPSYANYHSHMGVSVSGDSEAMLRKEAIQHIRESTRPLPHKMLSDDPDETNASESDGPRKLVVYQDPNNHITPLVTQTRLLTDLLQVYDKSSDQKGLREDIGMLVSVQNRGFAAWMSAEARKRRRLSGARKVVEDGASKEDEEVRQLLSAGAGMWQDGSGEGVVDVFGTERRDRVVDRGSSSGALVGETTRARGDKSIMGVCGWDMVL